MIAFKWILPVAVVLSTAWPVQAQSDLGAAAASFAQAWRSKDAQAIVETLAPDGLTLRLVGERPAELQARPARAALSEFLGSRATGRLEGPRLRELGGSPERGSAEFNWQAVVQGTSEPMTHTVFVGFERVGAGWRIYEIRVF